MKIYIASSWKNQHGVEMLTELLRERGHEVISWVESGYEKNPNAFKAVFSFSDWMQTDKSDEAFWFDIIGATTCDLFIYYCPSGQDACAELGAAWAKGITIFGLWAKGEGLGLMQKMVSIWHERYEDLLTSIDIRANLTNE